MKQILFINHTFRAFDNLDSGASNRSAMFITALAKIGHVDVISFVDGEVSTIANCDVIFSQSVEPTKKSGRFAKFFQLFAAHNPHLVYPINKKKKEIIEQQLAKKSYDYISIRYISEAVECGLLDYANRLIIDIDDNPRDALLMSAKNAKTLRNKIFTYLFAGTMDKMVKYSLKGVLCCFHSNPYQTPIATSIYLHNVTKETIVIPDVIDKTPIQILVVGLYHYGPNKQGVDYFLNNIFPKVRNQNPQINLHVVGKIPDETTAIKWRQCNGVKVMGFVPDLTEEYKDARLVIVPIYSGSGTSVKVIEAMRMNRTCISTPQGMRGYDVMDSGTDYLLANNDEQFANHICNMINDINACNNISHNATIKINKYFSQEAFIKIIMNAINNA